MSEPDRATPFVETELLLAVMEDDYDNALRLLGDMLPGEQVDLARQADKLARFIRTGLLGPVPVR